MAILGTLLKKGIRLRDSLVQEYTNPADLQAQELQKLLLRARKTAFGQRYGFLPILKKFRQNEQEALALFRQQVPMHDYESLYAGWWQRQQAGEKNITWPGRTRYFALSSGTSGASSKYIPITSAMVKAIRKGGIRQMLSLSKYELPDSLFTKGILMLGGSTDLEFNGTYFSGDLSGITAGRLPIWFQRFYKPGKTISRQKNWGEKLDQIVEMAPKWDIGIIVGVPAWLQILMEKIIQHYQVNHIHDIWPNLQIFVHGGVSFSPYKKSFEKLLGRPLIYMETYLASEGFLAFQAKPFAPSMRLLLNNGIYYEFIPFDQKNFDADGQLLPEAEALTLQEVEPGKPYALLISTCAGAWRYLIGDVIAFDQVKEAEIRIVGRTKHFLSLCGEHLSVDNMNQGIRALEEKLDLHIREFTVIGKPEGNLFAHHWYIGSSDTVDEQQVAETLDAALKACNDDYAVERAHALKAIYVHILPPEIFYAHMRAQGKEGGQNKFPRVLKGEKASAWEAFIQGTK
ncbi:MAG: GH3 family domain-containing protein [Nitritalea sp.]